MIELNLEADEGILKESEDVTWIADTDIGLDRLVLTNNNIIICYQKSNGLFAGYSDEVIQYHISDIKVINDQPLVQQIKKEDYGMCLQIQFLQKTELFAFDSWGGKQSADWVNAIYKTITGNDAPKVEKASAFGDLSGIKSAIANVAGQAVEKVSNVAGSTMGTVSSMAKQAASDANASFNAAKDKYQDAKPQPFTITSIVHPVKQDSSFCANCGTKLAPGTKFCPSCGTPVSSQNSNDMQVNGQIPPIPMTQYGPSANLK